LKKYERASSNVVDEVQGSESDEFWQAIGGQGPVSEVPAYNRDFDLMNVPSAPYLLRYPDWELETTFDRSSLHTNHAYILQDHMVLFVWLGNEFLASWPVAHDGQRLDVDAIAAAIKKQWMDGTTEAPPVETKAPAVVEGFESEHFWLSFDKKPVSLTDL
jgi:hypothetical protein